jgi:hypothetical protein
MRMVRFLLCLIISIGFSTLSARANVYATDIKLNGSLATITNPVSTPITITYRLNEAATLGVTVGIWQGMTQLATINGGTKMGLNTVVWGNTNNSGSLVGAGTFSVTVTAGASGFPIWTQTSIDTNAGNYAFYPNGIAVDNNTNSPFYGRVIVGNSYADGTLTNPVSGAIILDGLYKLNADGSYADEGGFGYGGYTMDDYGYTSSGEMPPYSHFVPWILRIGGDDQIYMLDFSLEGAIVAFDMEVTTNQVVIDDGGADGGSLGGPHNYAGNPDFNDLEFGIGNFDVTDAGTPNAALWLCDSDQTNNWGIWMYHLFDGQSDTNDIGTQAVAASGDLGEGSTGGCSIDTNLNLYVSQYRTNYDDPDLTTMDFPNWNHGALPPPSSGFAYALSGSPQWAVGAADNTDTGVTDTVISSRSHPLYVATPMDEQGGNATNLAGYSQLNGGIRVLNASNGTVVTVTNGGGTVIQSLTNLDVGNWYTCAAWDNVGNLYAASPTTNLWRAWSPPGANTNTTTAVAQIILSSSVAAFTITGITAVPAGGGCSDIMISFTSPGNPATNAFTVLGSSSLNGPFTTVSGATITGSSGSYQAALTACATEFFKIEETQ